MSRDAAIGAPSGAAGGAPAGAAVSPASSSYVCLVCGAPMHERGCRVRCARCGYFEDCGNGLTPPPVNRGRSRDTPEPPAPAPEEAEK